MAEYVPAELQNVNSGNEQSLGNSNVTAFKFRGGRFTVVSDGTTPAIGDTIDLGYRRAGDLPIGVILASSANMAAASLAIGVAGTPAKYKAAASLPNATSVFVPFVSTALDNDPLAAREKMIATVSVAAIPAGTLVIIPVYGAR